MASAKPMRPKADSARTRRAVEARNAHPEECPEEPRVEGHAEGRHESERHRRMAVVHDGHVTPIEHAAMREPRRHEADPGRPARLERAHRQHEERRGQPREDEADVEMESEELLRETQEVRQREGGDPGPAGDERS